jgi:hypothetical protein
LTVELVCRQCAAASCVAPRHEPTCVVDHHQVVTGLVFRVLQRRPRRKSPRRSELPQRSPRRSEPPRRRPRTRPRESGRARSARPPRSPESALATPPVWHARCFVSARWCASGSPSRHSVRRGLQTARLRLPRWPRELLDAGRPCSSGWVPPETEPARAWLRGLELVVGDRPEGRFAGGRHWGPRTGSPRCASTARALAASKSVATCRRRPQQRGHSSTSRSKVTRIGSAHVSRSPRLCVALCPPRALWSRPPMPRPRGAAWRSGRARRRRARGWHGTSGFARRGAPDSDGRLC